MKRLSTLVFSLGVTPRILKHIEKVVWTSNRLARKSTSSRNTVPVDSTRTSFLTLPAELRNEVYRHYFPMQINAAVCRRADAISVSLLCASAEVHTEALSYFHNEVTLSTRKASNFLVSIPHDPLEPPDARSVLRSERFLATCYGSPRRSAMFHPSTFKFRHIRLEIILSENFPNEIEEHEVLQSLTTFLTEFRKINRERNCRCELLLKCDHVINRKDLDDAAKWNAIMATYDEISASLQELGWQIWEESGDVASVTGFVYLCYRHEKYGNWLHCWPTISQVTGVRILEYLETDRA